LEEEGGVGLSAQGPAPQTSVPQESAVEAPENPPSKQAKVQDDDERDPDCPWLYTASKRKRLLKMIPGYENGEHNLKAREVRDHNNNVFFGNTMRKHCWRR
jgi:hypothetical protein